MRSRIESTVMEIQGIMEVEKTLYDKFFQFASAPATKENIVAVTKTVLGLDINGGSKDITTYQKNRLNDLAGSITTEMDEKGNTLWGLFSGVTRYTTHYATGGEVGRAQSKAIGSGYKADNAVFDQFARIIA